MAENQVNSRNMLKADIRKSMYERLEKGLFPYNGQWLSREEVEQQLKADRKTGRIRALELLSLYFLFIVISLLLMVVVLYLAY